MNYNNFVPYYIPQATQRRGLSSLFKNGINFSNILTNTNKTLNIINQVIPIIKQATPLVKNTKTMFKVMNEFKKVDTPPTKNQQKEETPVNIGKQTPSSSVDQGPTINIKKRYYFEYLFIIFKYAFISNLLFIFSILNEVFFKLL